MDQSQELEPSQGYKALEYHLMEALAEKNEDPSTVTSAPPIAIFSRQYYNQIKQLNHEKIYDYCFLGSIDLNPNQRYWVLNFAMNHFTDKSIFISRDDNPEWVLPGSFNQSDTRSDVCPIQPTDDLSKEGQYRVVSEHLEYFQIMCQSRYVLCPVGKGSWSFEFYEALMCGCIPVVDDPQKFFRSGVEANIPYQLILRHHPDLHVSDEQVAEENTRLFEEYHLLH